ncbi:MAG: GGDEF domain-containing protein [Trichloromonadaceae bacterium]
MTPDLLNAHLREIIAQRRLTSWFQPIVDFKAGGIFGYEAFVRGPSDSPLHAPATLFETADRCGLLGEIELLCLETHARNFSRQQLPGKLFLNASPATLADPDFPRGFARRLLKKLGLCPDECVIEITENQPVHDFDSFRRALSYFRELGFSVAIDDLGAGYAGLRLWSELRPDYVKFDRHFIQGLGEDHCKQQFIHSLQEIANGLGCRTIAEGIETADELQLVRSLGVSFGQGHILSRPLATPMRQLPAMVASPASGRQTGPHLHFRSETVASLVRPVPPVTPETRVEVVGEQFATHPTLLTLPIVAEGLILGVVRREELLNLLARQFGRELHGRDPIREFMDLAPLTIEKDVPVEQLSRLLTDRPQVNPLHEFIITDQGHYLGVGTIIDLLRKVTELQVRYARYANPLTLLPGNVPINEQIELLLDDEKPFAACYFDLDNFKPYNDHYGYSRGDMIIRFVGSLLSEAADTERDFVGHIGGDDFMVIFQSEDWQQRCDRILQRFAREAPGFYNPSHRSEGGIWSEDRAGQAVFYPLLSLSVGAVQSAVESPTTCHEIASRASEAKRQAKKQPGNVLFIERRSPTNHPAAEALALVAQS